MHNENEGSILLYISQPINDCVAKITIANILDFFGDVIEAWRDAWVDFILIRSRSLKILSSWLKVFFLTMSFEKEKQICRIKLQNPHMHPYILTSA